MSRFHNRFYGKKFFATTGLRGLIKTCSISCMFAGLVVILFMSTSSADEVIMKNGDRLQGSVVSMALGKLVFKTPYAGEIAIDWNQVAHLTTEGPIDVYLGDEKTLTGKSVATADGALVLQPESGPATSPITMAQVQTLDRPKPPGKWEYSVRVSAGASKERGNTNTQKNNLDGQLTLFKFPHVIKLYGEYHREKKDGDLSKDNRLGSLTYERFISKKWFLFGNSVAATDKFKDLNLQAQFAAGPGYQFWKSRSKNLSVKLGPAYVMERYKKPMKNFNNKDHRDYAAAYWAMDFDMWFFNRFLQLFHHDDGLLDFEETDNWQVRTRTGMRVPISFGFFASLQFNYDFVNTPADNKKKYDQAYLFKLGWSL